MTKKEVNETLRELAEYTRLQTELTAQIDALKDKVKEFMTTENITELTGGCGEKVYWSEIVSRRLDTQLLKKQEAEIYEHYLKDSVSKPFKFYC